MSQQRCILMTGASSGIGKSICDQLLQSGHQVIGLSRHPARQEPHENHTPVSFDLRNLRQFAVRSSLRLALPQPHAQLVGCFRPVWGAVRHFRFLLAEFDVEEMLPDHQREDEVEDAKDHQVEA